MSSADAPPTHSFQSPTHLLPLTGNIANADVDYTQVLHDTGGDVLMGDVTADDFDDADLMAEFAAIGGDPEELK
ncbi:hypothetical protein SARC_14761, partial [Sphaeroforma arctica JP610]